MKKVVRKRKVTQKDQVVTVGMLERVLDDRFNKFEKKSNRRIDKKFQEQTKIILEAVSDVIDKKLSDSERRMLAYTELRTQEILDVFKDDRIENIRKFNVHGNRLDSLENKVRILENQ